MSEVLPPPSVLRFGAFEADLRAGELRKRRRKIRLQEKPFQVLAALLQRPGEVVTREELREKLWPAETFVEFDDNINTAISRVREALGDTAEHPRFVETLPRHGYRFIAAVESPDGPSRPAAGLRLVWIAGLAFVALVVAAFALNVGQWRERLFGTGSSSIRSLAVLPLENLSGNPDQEYFADGMTEALITELGKISALRVISRQSVMQFKGTQKPVPEIARQLNVDAVVEGAVVRDGDQVRITAQLIAAAPERHLWAESFERDWTNVLALQQEVARAIASQIRITLTPEEEARLARARPVDPEAYEAYLKGRYFWNKRSEEGLQKAIEYFGQAIDKDPTYALAYAGLADTYVVQRAYGTLPPKEAYRQATAAARKALEIDDTLAEAYASLGLANWIEWDWSGAATAFQRALELKPNYATAHHWYAFYLSSLGRHEEALIEIERAQVLDPLSIVISRNVGMVFFYARRYDEANQEFRRALELDPNDAGTHGYLGWAYLAKGMHHEAISEFQKVLALGIERASVGLACAYALAGSREEAVKILGELEKESKRRYNQAPNIALIYAHLGNRDSAFQWLERALQQRDYLVTFLKVLPRFDVLRSDPRFQDLVRRMNFPD